MKEQLKTDEGDLGITKTLMDQKLYVLYVADFRFPNF